jgi:hypothetical protein
MDHTTETTTHRTHRTHTPEPNFSGSAAPWQCYTATTVRPNPARANFANNKIMSQRNLFTDFGQVPITPPPHGSAFFPSIQGICCVPAAGQQGLQTMHSAPHQPYLRLQNFLTATIRPNYHYDPANNQDNKGHKRMSKIPRSLWTEWAAMCAGLDQISTKNINPGHESAEPLSQRNTFHRPV